jgi:hypothetical protein
MAPCSASSMQSKHKMPKIHYIRNTDGGIQSTDTRRRYMRRGSKTPMMLLLNSSIEMESLGKSFFPTSEAQFSDIASTQNVSYQSLNRMALALASAIDVLPESYLSDCRAQRKSISLVSDDNTDVLNTPIDAYRPNIDTERVQSRSVDKKFAQPRRLSAMTILKQNLESISISSIYTAANLPTTIEKTKL